MACENRNIKTDATPERDNSAATTTLDEDYIYYDLTDERIFFQGARAMLQALLDNGYIEQLDKPIKAHNKKGEKVKLSDSKQQKIINTATMQKLLKSRYTLEYFLSGNVKYSYKWYNENDTDFIKCNVVTPIDGMRAKQAAMDLLFDMAIKKEETSEHKPLDTGFRVLKLMDSGNGNTKLDFIFEILLDLGIPFDTCIEKREANGNTVYIADSGNLYVCLDEHIDNEVAKSIACCIPLFVVFDIKAITPKLELIFKIHSPYTFIKAVDYQAYRHAVMERNLKE